MKSLRDGRVREPVIQTVMPGMDAILAEVMRRRPQQGLFVVGVINNGMSFTGISPNAKPVVIGIIIILAVLADRKGNSSR